MPDFVQLHDLKFRPMLSAQRIRHRVQALGAQLTEDYKGKKPLFIAILNGSFMFTADLMRAFHGTGEISFVKLASYHGTHSTGSVTEMIGLEADVEGRDVVLIEDIVDSGETLQQFLPELQKKNPASINMAVLLLKPEAVRYNFEIKYLGFEIPNDFVIGYGMDYDGLGRNLPSLYVKVEEFWIDECAEGDLEHLRRLARDTFDVTYRHLNDPQNFQTYLKDAFDPVKFKTEFDHPESTFLTAYENDEMVGYLKINEGSAQTEEGVTDGVEIERIYLKPSTQGKGYGKKMIEEVKAFAKKRNKPRVWLGVWEKNPNAMAFYQKCGFKKFGEHAFHLGPERQLDYLLELYV